MGTVGRIHAGIAADLIERCADVHLKERRPLVIAPGEMPFNLIHLRNLTGLAEAGATIATPIPAWYTGPIHWRKWWTFWWCVCSMAWKTTLHP